MKSKNVGSANGRAKLNENDVIEIKRLYKSGYLQRDLADMYNTSRSNIAMVLTKRSWKNVQEKND